MCCQGVYCLFTFGNITIATDGEPVASVSQVRQAARASHSLFYHGAMHLSSVPACKLSTAAAEKKERAKRAKPTQAFTMRVVQPQASLL